ncbi:hypothetical protein HK101_001521 [Irineochytrium annulatum]|nr:hypothetical protein HK101_001521 [Irineochytrium annulatum]
MGQMLFSYPWGIFADTVGRKPALLIGLAGSSICITLFGLSPTFAVALTLRAICGSLNGIVSITKTVISEICSQENQGQAFGILGVARAVGLIVGPAAGGFLSQLGDKYPQLFPPGSLVAQFPYAVPCLLGGLISLLGFVAAYLILDETKAVPVTSKLEPVTNAAADERTALLATARVDSTADLEADDIVKEARSGPLPAWKLLADKKISLTIALYALISGLYIQYDEVFSLWSKEPISSGGLSFTTSDIGTVFAFGGVFLFVYQIFIFPRMERAFGSLRCFRMGVLLCIPVFLLVPNLSDLVPEGEVKAGWSVWVSVIALQALRTCASLQAFTSSFIMTSNACPSHSRGSANGISQSFGAFGRMVGPIFAGNVFSWSLSSGLPAPFDFHLLFYLLAVISVGVYGVSLWVEDSIDYRVD